MRYRIKRWWFGRVIGVCSVCRQQTCPDYPNPDEQPYLARWRGAER